MYRHTKLRFRQILFCVFIYGLFNSTVSSLSPLASICDSDLNLFQIEIVP
jgi:hypothetical protein